MKCSVELQKIRRLTPDHAASSPKYILSQEAQLVQPHTLRLEAIHQNPKARMEIVIDKFQAQMIN